MSDGYRKQRNTFGNYGGSLIVTPFVGSTTLVAPNPAGSLDSGYTIYVQRIHIHCSSGQAATTWNVTTTSGISLTGAVSVAAGTTTVGQDTSIPTQDPIQAEFDFGPEGIALPVGDSLIFTPSSSGAAGVISWDAYQKLTSTSGFGS